MKRILAISSLSLFCFAFSLFHSDAPAIDPQDGVAATLYALGQEKPNHFRSGFSAEDVARGRDLVYKGKTDNPPAGERSAFISQFYTCTSCHNQEREDFDLSSVDPDARLQYAEQNDLPYLQGSTFWGIVNRESWYNDDYVKKYGSLVENAKNSLEGSTQLCAEVCSQGRTLEEWEMEAILAYYWSLEMKIGDLGMSQGELNSIQNLSNSDAVALIKSKYLQGIPATFGHPPADKKAGYANLLGRATNGKILYDRGCKHCHSVLGESDLVLDDHRSTFKWLKRNMDRKDQLSIYEVIRKGTYAELGHKEYMPNYTEEKMSNQQLEDLRAYIEEMASKR